MQYHVYAIPTTEDTVGEGIHLGEASNEAEAIALLEAQGFIVVKEGAGGLYMTYDAEDAPGIFKYEADGLGAIGITTEA